MLKIIYNIKVNNLPGIYIIKLMIKKLDFYYNQFIIIKYLYNYLDINKLYLIITSFNIFFKEYAIL